MASKPCQTQPLNACSSWAFSFPSHSPHAYCECLDSGISDHFRIQNSAMHAAQDQCAFLSHARQAMASTTGLPSHPLALPKGYCQVKRKPAQRTCDDCGDVVGGGVVEAVADISRKEAPVRHVEGHVAEGQQLEQQQDEEQQRQALADALRAVAQVVERQACGRKKIFNPLLHDQDFPSPQPRIDGHSQTQPCSIQCLLTGSAEAASTCWHFWHRQHPHSAKERDSLGRRIS